MNKYCSKCGAKLFAEDRYCPECGCKCIEERTQSNIKTKKTTRTNSKESVKYNKTYIKYIYVAISLSVIIIAAIYYVPLIAQEIAWNNATRENNIDSYNKYLEIYPEGEHSSSAIEKRDKCVKEYDKYFENGNHLFNQDDFHGALREYSEALRINPKSFGVIYNRGLVKANMKDYIGAVNDFTRAIEIEPKSSKSFTFRGSAKEALKDYTGAIDDYTKAIEIMPYNELAYVSRGVALYKQNKQNQAILDYKKVLEINPNNITANNNMGWMSIDMKEYFYATDYLSQAYRADSVNIDILLGLSLCNYLKSDTATAKNYLIKAIEVDERVKLGYSMIPLLEKEGYYYSGNQKKLLKELFGWMSTIIENTIKNDVDNKPL